jgi:hypothetical protein
MLVRIHRFICAVAVPESYVRGVPPTQSVYVTFQPPIAAATAAVPLLAPFTESTLLGNSFCSVALSTGGLGRAGL